MGSRAPEVGSAAPQLSIVVPLYNEAENVSACHADITAAMREAGFDYEVIYVDDGSTDGTAEALRDVMCADPRATLLVLRRNFGQAAALAAGFDHARADVVVAMDGDLQNDPRDIPALVAALSRNGGYDVASGWRRPRMDNALRRLCSAVANTLISAITGVRLHDYGCTLKAYRRDVLKDVRLYGETHRFIPALVRWVGGRVTEMPVHHRPRRAGRSKYGFGRIFRVLLDLMTVKFIMKYLTRPLYFFGKVGFVTLLMAFIVLGVVIAQKLYGTDMTGNPLLYLSVTFLVISVQFLLMGLIMEVLTRTYHESQGRKTYAVRALYRGGCGGQAPASRQAPPGAS